MEVVGQVFQRGIEQLGRDYRARRQGYDRPPHRPEAQQGQRNEHTDQCDALKLQAVLRPPRSREPGAGKPDPAQKVLILVYLHSCCSG
jgi:hypothetical protein